MYRFEDATDSFVPVDETIHCDAKPLYPSNFTLWFEPAVFSTIRVIEDPINELLVLDIATTQLSVKVNI
jgi:hypothetical protein